MQRSVLPRWWQANGEKDDIQGISWTARIGQIILWALAVIGLLSILSSAWTYTAKGSQIIATDADSTVQKSCSCGSNPEEALSRGCKFDVLAMAWLPAHCRDDELSDMLEDVRVEQNHTWTYHSFPNATEQLSTEQVSLLAGDPDNKPDKVVTTMDWHHSHCLYLIWKQARAPKTGVVMEGRYAEKHHQMHCMKSVLEFVATVPESPELLAISQVDLYPDSA